ncbi:hypothetical protein [Nostoc sp. TCL26-01]|uniref:hypothetical protein n=1 Tax=Nostoc sp. TCL26-01 TaxID=2576904 RepID=UPI0015BFB578|nr:hypothetical protein [Nostoc sp. TCL26-01]QLE56955.1 hypothetical protein FD725_16385 [Nostoc sp. TCL26-01]
MNTKPENTTSKERLILPEPDTANITVLAHNLPNDPIIPWNHFAYPWLNRQTKKQDPRLSTNLLRTLLMFRLLSKLAPIMVMFILGLSYISESKDENKQSQHE